mmetsp:Transcript_66319/g.138243  ORF Transcript_66319/g.138243 Transcript_66319/m.138243 type:complete len:242 (+) Transcript_66319:388-1113(+)
MHNDILPPRKTVSCTHSPPELTMDASRGPPALWSYQTGGRSCPAPPALGLPHPVRAGVAVPLVLAVPPDIVGHQVNPHPSTPFLLASRSLCSAQSSQQHVPKQILLHLPATPPHCHHWQRQLPSWNLHAQSSRCHFQATPPHCHRWWRRLPSMNQHGCHCLVTRWNDPPSCGHKPFVQHTLPASCSRPTSGTLAPGDPSRHSRSRTFGKAWTGGRRLCLQRGSLGSVFQQSDHASDRPSYK